MKYILYLLDQQAILILYTKESSFDFLPIYGKDLLFISNKVIDIIF